ncbi:hypothetical protein [Arthrobacter sp. SDTb3-6]|uniref:hypothetical protein n=1 Tax=Arthrobacter sp. SDTb3-6 TaxID=2713571 RepID=UPI00159D843B|nr:hypothetical protein [Arthrobacter sp. SDTb3-6]NVM99582.1 hypothetical protein [Arthrobacter sp. SDTb3-6]
MNPLSAVNQRGLAGASHGNPLRTVLVAALVVVGAAHIPVIPGHLHEAPYIGVLFVLLAAASFTLAGVVAFRGTPEACILTTAVEALAVTAYVISRTAGLPLIGDDVGNWLEPLGVVSVVAELVACVAAVALCRNMRRRRGAHTGTAQRHHRGLRSAT